MRFHALIVFVTLATGGICALAQPGAAQTEPGKAQAPPNAADAVSKAAFQPGAGTVIVGELARSLDAGKLKVNGKVECSLLQDLLYKGKVVVPKDAKVVGYVAEAASSKEQTPSRLALVFDKIVLRNKKELPFQYPASVIALGAPITWSLVSTTRMQDMPVKMEKGVDTGGAAVSALVANPGLAGANVRSGGKGALDAGSHGVIGIKGLALETDSSGMSVIVSKKGDVKLGIQTQVVIRVTDPPKR